MEIPFHYSLNDFEEYYLDSLIKYPDSNKLALLRKYKTIYEDVIKEFQNLQRELQVNLVISVYCKTDESVLEFNKKINEIDSNIIHEFNKNVFSADLLQLKKGTFPLYTDEYNHYIDSKEFEILDIVNFIDTEIYNEKINLLRFQGVKTDTPEQPETPEIEPYSKEIGKGKNIPYKLALLRDLGLLDILNKKYSNNSEQLYRILDYLTGGNSKNYYLSMYGSDYNGKDKVTHSHTAHLRENDLI